MQYHFDGFRSGDPNIHPEATDAGQQSDDVDVLIVGCGPAGLTLAAQLSAFPDIRTRIVEQKSGPLQIGQADGIACRSMEMFEAFGFADKVAREAYWVNETTFWRPAPSGDGIVRGDRIQDVEDDLSEMPHTILSQARVHDFYLEVMRNAPRRLVPDYNLRLSGLKRDDGAAYPVTAMFESTVGGSPATIRTKYLVGCDGARSAVRSALGYELKGEAARQLWGVMDVLVTTDFPDIRFKCAIQSANRGSILIIPREGGTLVRLYIELDELRGEERAADRKVTPELLLEKTRAIIAPYTIDLKEVAWCSAYEIGQRVCDTFDDVGDDVGGDTGLNDPDAQEGRQPRIFIAGDACHTHSPKAGQGMNVSMADTFNLGWKLTSVLRGQADPKLLHTYSGERRAKAKELIDFDRDMAKLFSSRSDDSGFAERFQQYFQKHGRYTAGVETRYDASVIVGGTEQQALAAGLTVGKRFHSAPVIRLADAKPLQLGHVLKADGRWRLILFAGVGDNGQPGGPIAELCRFLSENGESPVRGYTPAGSDIASVIDVRAVFQTGHRDLALEAMPGLLKPAKGKHGLTDYEKIFCPDLKSGNDIFTMRGIDRQQGAMVIVRPDQFVAAVLELEDRQALTAFFEGFMVESGQRTIARARKLKRWANHLEPARKVVERYQ